MRVPGGSALGDEAAQSLAQLFGPERLFENRPLGEPLVRARLAIASEENEGDGALRQDLRDRMDRLAGEIDVEDGAVEVLRARHVLGPGH